jgi:hypothetical protein
MPSIPLKYPVARSRSRDLRRLKSSIIDQLLQCPKHPALGNLGSFLICMAWSQFPIGLVLFEQVIDASQEAMGQSRNGFLAAHPFRESLVEGVNVKRIVALPPIK